MNWLFRHNKSPANDEVLLTLKRVRGQTLQDVTFHNGEWQLHFPDWVIFVEKPFPSPIIERISWSENK